MRLAVKKACWIFSLSVLAIIGIYTKAWFQEDHADARSRLSAGKALKYKSEYDPDAQYPLYQPGDTLPQIIGPPLETHTHLLMVWAAAKSAGLVLREFDMSSQLIDESLAAQCGAINQAFERGYVEYVIGKYYSHPEYERDRAESVTFMARLYAVVAAKAAAEAALRGSPLQKLNEQQIAPYLDTIAMAIYDHVLLLNHPEKLREFRNQHQDMISEQEKMRREWKAANITFSRDIEFPFSRVAQYDHKPPVFTKLSVNEFMQRKKLLSELLLIMDRPPRWPYHKRSKTREGRS